MIFHKEWAWTWGFLKGGQIFGEIYPEFRISVNHVPLTLEF